MWSTRRCVLVQNLILLALIIVIRLELRPTPSPDTSEPDENPLFLDTVRNALDAIYYLQDMERGRAYIAPVVEDPQAIVLRRPCQNNVERVFRDGGWIRNGIWHVFSAYVDLRNNSLYPGKASVQVGSRRVQELFNGRDLLGPCVHLWLTVFGIRRMVLPLRFTQLFAHIHGGSAFARDMATRMGSAWGLL